MIPTVNHSYNNTSDSESCEVDRVLSAQKWCAVNNACQLA